MNMPEEQAGGQPQQPGAAVQRGPTAAVRRRWRVCLLWICVWHCKIYFWLFQLLGIWILKHFYNCNWIVCNLGNVLVKWSILPLSVFSLSSIWETNSSVMWLHFSRTDLNHCADLVAKFMPIFISYQPPCSQNHSSVDQGIIVYAYSVRRERFSLIANCYIYFIFQID